MGYEHTNFADCPACLGLGKLQNDARRMARLCEELAALEAKGIEE